MPRLTGRPVGFSFADGTARFEVVVPKTGGRVRRRRTIAVASEQEGLDRFEVFKREILDAIRARPAADLAHAVSIDPGPGGTVVDAAFKREIIDAIHASSRSRGGRPAASLTFGAYLDRHLDAVCSRVQAKTATGYRQFVRNHLRPYFGELPLSAINMAVVKDFHGSLKRYVSEHPRWRGRALSSASINGCLTVLRLFVRDAFERGLLPALPPGGWPSETTEILSLEASAEEQRQFLAAFDDAAGFSRLPPAERTAGAHRGKYRFSGRPKTLRGSWSADHPATVAAFARFRALHPLFVVAFHTGLRRGDLLSLAWSSVDLDAGVLRVGMRKTKKCAVIPISAACRRALLACRARASESPLVFTDADGHPVSEAIFALAFSTAKVIAGIARRFRPHDMRHSFASRLASEAVSLQVISTALGHSTITLTQRYAKPNAESLRKIADALDRQDATPGGEK